MLGSPSHKKAPRERSHSPRGVAQKEVSPSMQAETNARTPKRVRVAPNLYQRPKDGRYEHGFTGPDGKWHIETLAARTITEAKKELRTRAVKVDRGEMAAPSKVTLAEVWTDYEKTLTGLVAAGEKRPRTLELYRQQWRSHLEPALGRVPVQKITAGHVSRLLADLRQKGKSSWTIKAVWYRLDTLFDHAMTLGLIAESPLKRVSKSERPSGKAKTQPRTLTNDDCGKLIAKASERWRPLIATCVFTGLRISELLALRWQDVNFAEGVIRVRGQLSVSKGDKPSRIVPLKTGAGERDVYLMAELAGVLRRQKLASTHSVETDFLFATYEGRPISQRNALRMLSGVAVAAGLNPEDGEPLSWHDLRHTAISRLIAAGLDVVEVQRQAGHSKPSTTLDTYSHEFERAKRSDDTRAKIAATGIGAMIEQA
jgi:integrase